MQSFQTAHSMYYSIQIQRHLLTDPCFTGKMASLREWKNVHSYQATDIRTVVNAAKIYQHCHRCPTTPCYLTIDIPVRRAVQYYKGDNRHAVRLIPSPLYRTSRTNVSIVESIMYRTGVGLTIARVFIFEELAYGAVQHYTVVE